MTRRILLYLAVTALPLILALAAAPAGAQAPTVVVTSPQAGAVVEGLVAFQGTAEDPDSDLDWVEIIIAGVTGPPLKQKITGDRASATWEISWNSQGVADGRQAISVVATDKAGNASAPTNLTLIVDNVKQPQVENLQLLFDAQSDGKYAPWNKVEEVPTTRLSFKVQLSEEMAEASLRSAVSLAGGASTWDLTPKGDAAYWVNVSYLQANTSYNFTVGTGATDMAGNPLTDAYAYPFHTAAEPTPGTPEGPGDSGGGGFNLPLSLDSPLLWVGVVAAAAVVGVAVAWRKGLLTRLKEKVRGVEWRSEEDDE